jgi:hypothetical protein
VAVADPLPRLPFPSRRLALTIPGETMGREGKAVIPFLFGVESLLIVPARTTMVSHVVDVKGKATEECQTKIFLYSQKFLFGMTELPPDSRACS